jgi:hypothetical protein
VSEDARLRSAPGTTLLAERRSEPLCPSEDARLRSAPGTTPLAERRSEPLCPSAATKRRPAPLAEWVRACRGRR